MFSWFILLKHSKQSRKIRSLDKTDEDICNPSVNIEWALAFNDYHNNFSIKIGNKPKMQKVTSTAHQTIDTWYQREWVFVFWKYVWREETICLGGICFLKTNWSLEFKPGNLEYLYTSREQDRVGPFCII